ncbi:SDR family NAD(P)-dependent oxidoreductase [Allorhizocola rhizosphaerae]|uniref:SDR family NAD(P)-dependent oxidoreductase n=1 Tax=Allorhizocola rhizosphaerae TaxID=1872709 RepID=UPI000E3C825B|nr:SDR family oxidoreductase [Allorhizocola rhizosphaerae]
MTAQPFAGQHIVVTGGGTGIGRAAALAFADGGAERVVITGRRLDRLEQVAAQHRTITPVVADVSTGAGADAVAAAVAQGGVDVLVHNAGIHRRAPVESIDAASAREVFATNVIGPVILTVRLMPLIRSPGGNIVFVSSVAGHNPVPTESVYGASKAAVDSLTKTWAAELAPKGIRVNAVAPSLVRTEVFETNGMTPEQVDMLFQHAAKQLPLGRTGEPEDVTLWITRLAEPSSSWVTGQVIVMDGGWDLA